MRHSIFQSNARSARTSRKPVDWLSKLSCEPRRFGDEELADMLEETGWFVSDFQKAFNELISEGQVKNLDTSRKRPVHAVHFDKGEFLKRLNS